MKLRIGQPVQATDGAFGEVADIVVDPVYRSDTHLVVEPHHQHRQARLVPMSLITVDGDLVNVRLDIRHIRELREVAATDFVLLDDMIDLGPDWEVGAETILSTPNLAAEDHS